MKWFLVLLMMAPLPGAGMAQQKLKDVTNEPGFETLKRDATRWLEAVRAGDLKVLVSFVLPESRDIVQREMMDERSRLSVILLTGPNALHKYLKAQPRRTLVLLQHRDLITYGEGTTACFYRPDSLPEALPRFSEALPDCSNPALVFCTSWARDEGRWYVDYSFADDEDGA
jgi:hypothetical protein